MTVYGIRGEPEDTVAKPRMNTELRRAHIAGMRIGVDTRAGGARTDD